MNLLQILFDNMNSLTNDYGLTIILITMLFNVVLLPLTIKQKKSMKSMQGLTEKTNVIKEKYKNNESKMNEELQALYAKNSKSFLGILLMFIQMPAFIVMYRLFTNNITSVSTNIFPWLTSLSVPDPYFILPILYVLVQIMPNILVSMSIIKTTEVPKISKQLVIVPTIMAVLLVSNVPSALGIYFVTSSFIQSTQRLFL
ncbi:membrane protein insertase YidC [Clostridium sp. D2Q-11]|uniref:Membrane protein insertase YidC n=1 Tax=Anaeromonas frigoriresistens TaxID=2683708 RepID=A0A942Z9P6_9FIRM|nr:YidC/Oxa1 family membrane protein insertase [Anaeromonas frigoriresistens]MBS4539379.1 membrane protein insertase YidC [Anaeromonas frigoriresistens]